MRLVSRYVAHMSLRRDGACYSNRRMRHLERRSGGGGGKGGATTEEFLPSA